MEPDDEITIIEDSDEAREKYGTRYGVDFMTLSDEHIAALKSGKCLAANNGEYSQFIVYRKD